MTACMRGERGVGGYRVFDGVVFTSTVHEACGEQQAILIVEGRGGVEGGLGVLSGGA